jgi:xanthine/CO dehydrogenase XdhC/CoxF family maturation factor
MGAVLVPVILLLVVLVLAAVAIKTFTRANVEHSDRLQHADRPTLRYALPPGQDPALVVAELRRAGYEVSPDSEPGPSSPIVIIGTHDGEPDREAVRRALADIDGTNIVPGESGKAQRQQVRFVDES